MSRSFETGGAPHFQNRTLSSGDGVVPFLAPGTITPDVAQLVPNGALLVHDGALHNILPGYQLGASIDPEADGQPNSTATGDDTDGNYDEDTAAIHANASDYGARAAVSTHFSDGGRDTVGHIVEANRDVRTRNRLEYHIVERSALSVPKHECRRMAVDRHWQEIPIERCPLRKWIKVRRWRRG